MVDILYFCVNEFNININLEKLNSKEEMFLPVKKMKGNTKDINILPLLGEMPSEYADRLGVFYSSRITDEYQKKLGQFFTPLSIAKFMADFCKLEKEKIKILDPGCGVGILAASLAEVLIIKNINIKTIEIVAFETDVNILPLAESCFRYLGTWLNQKGIEFTFFLCKNDFVLHNSLVLNNQEKTYETYDIIISNPPYFKLPNNDDRAIAARHVIYGQTNIYTIFLLIAAKLLKENGQLIFITPRSFCSGNYFRLFRELFFSIVDIKTVHLFDSRKAAFKRDKILQENIIITANKKRNIVQSQMELPFINNESELEISSSFGIEDIKARQIKRHKFSNLVNINSQQKILHLPCSDIDEEVIRVFKTWTGSLCLYDLKISTGPVVGFRSLDMIKFKKSKNTVPLIWLTNVESMNFDWPRNNGLKGNPKGQYITKDESSVSRLVKNTNYVLLRRFSTKDDNKRLIATPYISNCIQDATMIGIENHLNYIYHKKEDLTIEQVTGIAAIFNSRLFDLYFRTFNGNINVSATELRNFPLPSFQLIQSLGDTISKIIKNKGLYDIDKLILKTFNLTIDLSQIYG